MSFFNKCCKLIIQLERIIVISTIKALLIFILLPIWIGPLSIAAAENLDLHDPTISAEKLTTPNPIENVQCGWQLSAGPIVPHEHTDIQQASSHERLPLEWLELGQYRPGFSQRIDRPPQ